MSQTRALLQTTKSVYFEHEDKAYRYWYTRAFTDKPGKLRLNVKRAELERFRTTRGAGTLVEDLVDICETGSGWFEVTSKDFSNLDALTGSTHDGLKPWLEAFNKFFLKDVNANKPKVKAEVVAVHETKIVTVMATEPVAPLHVKRVTGTITLPRKGVDQSKLNQLRSHFRK